MLRPAEGIMRGFLYGILTWVIILTIIVVSCNQLHGASMRIPLKNHFIVERTFWQKLFRKMPTEFVIEVKGYNNEKEPREVEAQAEIIQLDKDGNLYLTGKFLQVEPEKTTIYPEQTRHFKVHWTLPSYDTSIIINITFTSYRPAGDNFTITYTMAYPILLTRALDNEWRPEPKIEVDKEKGLISIINYGSGFEGCIYKMRGDDYDTKETRRFFITNNTRRDFNMSLNDVDAIVLDVGNISRRYGKRLNNNL